MTLTDVLERLDPLQQKAVTLVYFEGRSPNDAARFLTVETRAVGAALSAAYRSIARWLIDDDGTTSSTLHGSGASGAARGAVTLTRG